MASSKKPRINLDKIAQVQKRLGDDLERKLLKAALVVESVAIQTVSKGQPVRRQKSGRLVGLDPSKPGFPPKVLSGRLKKSITHKVERTPTKITVRVGTNVVYARRLEFGFVGTDKAGRNVSQEARPWLRPSFRRTLPRLKAILNG